MAALEKDFAHRFDAPEEFSLDDGRANHQTTQETLAILLKAGADPYALVDESWEKKSGLDACNYAAVAG